MKIADLRTQIDSLDNQILELLNQRAACAQAIGEIKRMHPSETPRFFDPERELKILERLQQKSKGIFPTPAVAYVFREIISACRSLETPMKIAFLGPAGTFTQIAAQRSFGNSAEYVESATIAAVFEAIDRGQAEFGVVPLENSAEGGVKQSLEALLNSNLKIRSESVLKIDHCLVSKSLALSEVQKVYSHPQALAQCRRWLGENLSHATIIEANSTAAAAKLAATEARSAAVASQLSAEILNLRVLREGIQDQAGNATRFVVIAGEDAPPTGSDRTSFVCVPKNEGKALAQVLESFTRAKIEITRFESYAHVQEKWRHRYFVDIRGHRLEAKIKKALTQAARHCQDFKIFGSYPVGLETLNSTLASKKSTRPTKPGAARAKKSIS